MTWLGQSWGLDMCHLSVTALLYRVENSPRPHEDGGRKEISWEAWEVMPHRALLLESSHSLLHFFLQLSTEQDGDCAHFIDEETEAGLRPNIPCYKSPGLCPFTMAASMEPSLCLIGQGHHSQSPVPT